MNRYFKVFAEIPRDDVGQLRDDCARRAPRAESDDRPRVLTWIHKTLLAAQTHAARLRGRGLEPKLARWNNGDLERVS